MKILADENIDERIITWMRGKDIEVLSVFESMRGANDAQILARTNAEGRVLLTKDLDFGEMTFSGKLPAVGVILLRLEGSVSIERLAILQQQWPKIAEHAAGHFVVVTRERLRSRPLPVTNSKVR